ncbi:MAG TPA: UDP-2,3-diacylglucosamine diphosphatase [Acidiferrobacterales bacterium]
MFDGSAPLSRHRTLWISDVHLGSPGCQARRLTRFLAENDCETLYLVGDIFDGWRLKKRFFWTPDHTRVIKAILAKARHGTKVYYVTGNHDEFMRQFVSKQLRLGRVRLANEVVHTTADGRRLLVVHGDRYDVVMTQMPWLAHAGDVGYEALLWGGEKLNGLLHRFALPEVPVSAKIKLAVKSAVQYLSGFDEQVMARCRADNLKGVVCGHTHHAETRQIRLGIVSYNCGDWVESCTALAEDARGKISILHAGAGAELTGRQRIADLPLG